MKVEIKNSDGEMVFVEVSEEIYAVLQEENKQQEHERYERRKHLDGRELSDYVVSKKRISENPETIVVIENS